MCQRAFLELVSHSQENDQVAINAEGKPQCSSCKCMKTLSSLTHMYHHDPERSNMILSYTLWAPQSSWASHGSPSRPLVPDPEAYGVWKFWAERN